MSKTYKATGINLKAQALGESDRLVTILTTEFGLIRAVAPGSRKHNSSLGGRSGMFVVNELLIAKGRSLDKITQAQTIKSYPGLVKDLGKLAASQYLAEICLYQALSDQPQEELFCLLNEHLKRLAVASSQLVLPHLTHAIFQLLVLAGIAGGGAYFWLKMQQKKREAEENKPDPDADYREDEEEIVLPEEEPESEPDEDAERKAYQDSDGYEE